MTTAQEIRWPKARAVALAGVASSLPEPLKEPVLSKALSAAREIGPADRPVFGAPHRTAGDMENMGRVEALVNVALHLPDPMREQVLGEALETVREIPSQGGFVDALGDLAPFLSDRLFGRAVELVQDLGSECLQAEAPYRLAPHLTHKPVRQALAAARKMDDAENRGHALSGLASRLARLSAAERNRAWLDAWGGTNLLRFLSRRPRYHLLSDLAALGPAISAMGGQGALEETRVAIEDVGCWWP